MPCVYFYGIICNNIFIYYEKKKLLIFTSNPHTHTYMYIYIIIV